MLNTEMDIYIIGAGISGLIAAYELEGAGFSPIILESGKAVGGRVREDAVDESTAGAGEVDSRPPVDTIVFKGIIGDGAI